MTLDNGYLLALETATTAASVALLGPAGDLRAELTFTARRTMAERLAPLIGELLAAVDVTPAEITRLAVGLGPGSFTSLRVGLATAKGLALGRDVAMIGVGSLEALAAAAPLNERQPICAVIPAPKRQVYAALYARWTETSFNCLFGPELLPLDELADRLAVSGQTVAVAGLLPAAEQAVLVAAGATCLPALFGVPRAAVVGWLGQHRLAAGERHDPATITPHYVLPSEPEVRFGRVLARPTTPEPSRG